MLMKNGRELNRGKKEEERENREEREREIRGTQSGNGGLNGHWPIYLFFQINGAKFLILP